ncbi:MAG: hypothetical protein Q9165_006160 [Trypethelium subeluteriae]
MVGEDDDDVHLQRASSAIIAKILRQLPKLVRKPSSTRLNSILGQLEPFQGDPQLLDVYLRDLLPVIITAYVKQVEESVVSADDFITAAPALSKILYTLCKIRGESPITGFFHNEAHYLEPFVRYFEHRNHGLLSWEERYILLLWLSHLSLAPFDLHSISTNSTTDFDDQELALSPNMPTIAVRMLRLALEHLSSSSREMKAAAKLLSRLCVRADMKDLQLPNSLARWTLLKLNHDLSKDVSTHFPPDNAQKRIGFLTYLGYFMSTSAKDVCAFVPQIYAFCQQQLDDSLTRQSTVTSSSTAKRAWIKLLRNIALVCLSPEVEISLDSSAIVEEVIGTLLESLGDKETPVRITASKALSLITMKLSLEMAEEIIQAILDSFDVNVFQTGDSAQADLSQVDPAQWHGLTLTLAQLLFRRAPPTNQLPKILRTLLRALDFEQRSSTGVSVGANVRDAANFGIWSLSRRYTPSELALIDATSIYESPRDEVPLQDGICIQQLLAVELLASACLDPAGNIRRGSSAALQELVGRHPDTVHEGISLVQIADYHAVGLRERAMVEISSAAAALGKPSIYLMPLTHHLLRWRGVGSGDTTARSHAARAIGRLSSIYNAGLLEAMTLSLEAIKPKDFERRHGLLLSLAALSDVACERYLEQSSVQDDQDPMMTQNDDLLSLTLKAWAIFSHTAIIHLSDRDFGSHALRPELITVAVTTLITCLARATAALGLDAQSTPGVNEGLQLVPLCLNRSDEASLGVTPYMARALMLMLPEDGRLELTESWLAQECKGNSRIALHQSGYVHALGAAFPHIDGNKAIQQSIIDMLCRRCGDRVEVEARVVALRSLGWVLLGKGRRSKGAWRTAEPTRGLPPGELGLNIIQAILLGLDDYTINERGDVGSLVRLQALETLEKLPRDLGSQPEYKNVYESICAASRRLSVEKLDKVRLKASHVFTAVQSHSSLLDLQTVSSYVHFRQVLQNSFWGPSRKIAAAVLEGFVTSAGSGGSEAIVQSTRAALVDVLNRKWAESPPSSQAAVLTTCNLFLEVMRQNLDNERVLAPILDTIGFLFDAGIFQRLLIMDFKWRNLLSLVQKSHYKSSSIPKILAAINCYRGLAEIDATREDVLRKLRSMLKHPFPKVREAVVETLFILTQDDQLKTLATNP